MSGIPSEPESEASDEEVDEETLEGRAVLRRRGAREMGDLYRDECLAFCGELLTLQKQWRKVRMPSYLCMCELYKGEGLACQWSCRPDYLMCPSCCGDSVTFAK